MITASSIADFIKQMICLRYPTCQMYLHNVPGSAARPYFQIHLDFDRSEDSNRFLTSETTALSITYFPPLEGEIPLGLEPFSVYDSIKGVFRKGFLKVGDRSLKVALIRGGKKDNEIFVIVKFVFDEERPLDEMAYEAIGEVNLKNN
ncbi:MAG: hypothetical protein N2484_09440 [Clostridia bacterium]|nr:hypothetical protein [Clostridia bacterium]